MTNFDHLAAANRSNEIEDQIGLKVNFLLGIDDVMRQPNYNLSGEAKKDLETEWLSISFTRC